MRIFKFRTGTWVSKDPTFDLWHADLDLNLILLLTYPLWIRRKYEVEVPPIPLLAMSAARNGR